MNDLQKKIMIAVTIGLVIAFLFPPNAFFREGGGAINMGYSFIANMPRQNSIHISMLFAEWLGIVIIGGIFYFIARNTQLEHAPPLAESNSTEDRATVPTSKHVVGIWLTIIIGFLLFYAFGASASVHIEWFLSLFASAFPTTIMWCALGALLTYKLRLTKSMKIAGFFMAWLLTAIIGLLMAEELSAVSAGEEMPLAGFIGVIVVLFLISLLKSESKEQVFIIGTIILVIWLFIPDQKSIISTQAVTESSQQTQAIHNTQQTTASSTENTNDIARRANDLYNQGRYAEAFPFVLQLAEQNKPSWQKLLGRMYEKGQGVAVDHHQAIHWYYKAAEIGDENEKDARAALNKLIAKEKKITPHKVQPLLPQAQQARLSNADEYVPPKIPGDTNNDGILSGSEQYLRGHH